MNTFRNTFLLALFILLAACSQGPEGSQLERGSLGCDDPWCIEIYYEVVDFGLPDPPCLSCGIDFIIVEDYWEALVISLPGRFQDVQMQLYNQQGEQIAEARPSANGEMLTLRVERLTRGHYQLKLESAEALQGTLQIQTNSRDTPLNLVHSLNNTGLISQALYRIGQSAILTGYAADTLGERIQADFENTSAPDIVFHQLAQDSSQLGSQALCEDCDDYLAINSEPHIIICDPLKCIKENIFSEAAVSQAISFDVSAMLVHRGFLERYNLRQPNTMREALALTQTTPEALCLHSFAYSWCGNELPAKMQSLLEPQPQPWYAFLNSLTSQLAQSPATDAPPAFTVGLLSEILISDPATQDGAAFSPQLLTDDQDPRAWGPLAPYVQPVFLEDLKASIIVTQAVINPEGNSHAATVLTKTLIDPEIQQQLLATDGHFPIHKDVFDSLQNTTLKAFAEYAEAAIVTR